MTNHVFRNVNRNKLTAIVDSYGETHKIRRYHRGAGPRFDDFALASLLELQDFLQKLGMNVRALFE